MSSIWGKNVIIGIFGESHGKAIGVTLDGMPAGEEIDEEKIARFMARRRPGGELSTQRKEADVPVIISGVFNGKTTGSPLTAVIVNSDTRSSDYELMSHCARPGHADYTAFVKYGGANDYRGGGHFSGRLTACLTFAGAVCSQILSRKGVKIAAHLFSVGGVQDKPFGMDLSAEVAAKLENCFPVIDDGKGEAMKKQIEEARAQKDSVGGVVECMITGLPAGIGSPMFDGVENKISSLVFGIPAVKGVEFGLGFEAANVRGSKNNDEFYAKDGKVMTKTNFCGGVLGGITDGMPVVFRAAFKPTPSIAAEQNTVDFKSGENCKIEVKGRHDPCVAVRAVPVVQAAAAIAVMDLLCEK